MHLKRLSLLNYKNITSQTFDFQEKINCFVGRNGAGKTNVLDAIFYLSFSKSYFNPIASQNIQHKQQFFVLEGAYQRDNKEEHIFCSFKKGQKKVIKRNGKAYERFSEHIGFLPLVIISPADRDLIVEGSETRRKFIDTVLSQLDREYLQNLVAYNKVLSQRNALLKYFAANRTFDALNLEVYDLQLSQLGAAIYAKRNSFIERFAPIFNARYAAISNGGEAVALRYKSQVHEQDMTALLKGSLEKDRVLQYTSTGIHKDDLQLEIDSFPIKKFGSQGQQKSFLIALKLAQFDFLKAQNDVMPILLLDDIFDKLDAERVSQLIALVNQEEFGQIFISDTHKDRTEMVLNTTEQPYKIFEL